MGELTHVRRRPFERLIGVGTDIIKCRRCRFDTDTDREN